MKPERCRFTRDAVPVRSRKLDPDDAAGLPQTDQPPHMDIEGESSEN